MRPTRDGKEYPWKLYMGRGAYWRNFSENVPAVAMATTGLPTASKQYCSSCRRCTSLVPKKVCEGDLGAGASSGLADMSQALPSFTKVMPSKYQIHISTNLCRLVLPKPFCDEHNVTEHVTMADSTGRTLWHMHFQSQIRARRGCYVISSGWREFSYDHSLQRNDKLVFTLVSPSHFVVEFATAKGCARVMRPTRDGKEYHWKHHAGRRAFRRNFSENVAAEATVTTASKQTKEEKTMFQCKSVKVDDRERNSRDSTEMIYSFPELTQIECKNADGMSYLQIFDSDEDEESGPE